ncbi:hypothetical protein C8J57DRAFT_1381663 [Mycena rebaudengoi]|nr:hypothetical protein C8J57DRAFT_1381663 [Mycena rebaudengoi]
MAQPHPRPHTLPLPPVMLAPSSPTLGLAPQTRRPLPISATSTPTYAAVSPFKYARPYTAVHRVRYSRRPGRSSAASGVASVRVRAGRKRALTPALVMGTPHRLDANCDGGGLRRARERRDVAQSMCRRKRTRPTAPANSHTPPRHRPSTPASTLNARQTGRGVAGRP